MSNALREHKFSSGLFLSDFPAKIRVLTTDPLVSIDAFGNTRFAFIIWNHDEEKAMIINKGNSFAQRFQEIDMDSDFGSDIQKIDIKITTNGKSGKETRYTITPVGNPYELTQDQIKAASEIKLEDKIKNGTRLSEVNKGIKPKAPATEDTEPENTQEDIVIEDVPNEPIDMGDIPF